MNLDYQLDTNFQEVPNSAQQFPIDADPTRTSASVSHTLNQFQPHHCSEKTIEDMIAPLPQYSQITKKELKENGGRVKGHFVLDQNHRSSVERHLNSFTSALLKKEAHEVIQKFEVDDSAVNRAECLRLQRHTALSSLHLQFTSKKTTSQTEEIRGFLRDTGSSCSDQPTEERLLIVKVHRIFKLLPSSIRPLRSNLLEIGVNKGSIGLAQRILKNLPKYPKMQQYLYELKTAKEDEDSAVSRPIHAIRDNPELSKLAEDIFKFCLFGSAEKLGPAAGVNREVPRTVCRFVNRQKHNQGKRILACGDECTEDHRKLLFAMNMEELRRDSPGTIEGEAGVGPQKRGRRDIPKQPKKRAVPCGGLSGEYAQYLTPIPEACEYEELIPAGSETPQASATNSLSSAVKSVVGRFRATLMDGLAPFLTNRKSEIGQNTPKDLSMEPSNFVSDNANEFFKELEEQMRVESTTSTSSSEWEGGFGTIQEPSKCSVQGEAPGLETMTEGEQAYGRVIEKNQEACEKLCLCLGPFSLGEGFFKTCYSVCGELFRHPVSDLKEALVTCGICVNPNTIILVWDLFRTIHGINSVDSELYLHMLEMAGRQGKSWALLWPLWKYSRLKDIYMNVLYLLIGHATVERKCEEIAQWLNQYLTVCNKDYSKHMQSLARKVVQALSDYIDAQSPLSFKPCSSYYFPTDPIQAILENACQAVTQKVPRTTSERNSELENVAKALELVYTGSDHQQSLLRQFLNSASSKKTTGMRALLASLLINTC